MKKYLLKIAEILSYTEIFAELGSKFGWVRAKNPSELGSENRKKNTAYDKP